MSPGNLYYHFKSKQEIVDRLFRRFEQSVEPIANAYGSVTALDDLWFALHLLFETVDRYRFIYLEIDHLMREYPRLRERAMRITAAALHSTHAMCEQLNRRGVLHASPEQIEVLSYHMVMTTSCWFTFARLVPQGASWVKTPGLAAYHVLTLLMPYVGEQERQYLNYLRHKYVGGTTRTDRSVSAAAAPSGTVAPREVSAPAVRRARSRRSGS